MTERTVVDCDKCGKEDVKNTIRIYMPNGRIPDAAGGPSETRVLTKDVCPACAEKLIAYIFHFQRKETVWDDASDPYGCRTKSKIQYVYNPHHDDENCLAVRAAKAYLGVDK
jgi:ssDNA-binding Zn-finger/Zn-ribbon topoisomerase 1